jgi:hypothetical protein
MTAPSALVVVSQRSVGGAIDFCFTSGRARWRAAGGGGAAYVTHQCRACGRVMGVCVIDKFMCDVCIQSVQRVYWDGGTSAKSSIPSLHPRPARAPGHARVGRYTRQKKVWPAHLRALVSPGVGRSETSTLAPARSEIFFGQSVARARRIFSRLRRSGSVGRRPRASARGAP